MNKRQEPSKHEYRVTYQRDYWVKPQYRWFQLEAYAFRFADRLEAGQQDHGWLQRLEIHRRPVGVWEPWDEDGGSG